MRHVRQLLSYLFCYRLFALHFFHSMNLFYIYNFCKDTSLLLNCTIRHFEDIFIFIKNVYIQYQNLHTIFRRNICSNNNQANIKMRKENGKMFFH